MSNLEQSDKKRFNYGIVVFALCFVMIFVVLGFGSSTKSTYLKAICDDLGFERSVFSLNNSLQYIVSAVLNFFFGTLIYKLGARKLIGVGFITLIGAFTVYYFSYDIWQFYVAGALLGAGCCLTGTAVVSYTIGKWFPENKGTMVGITLAANGFGGMVSEILITNIVYNSESLKQKSALYASLCDIFRTDGWRLACILTAILFVSVGIVILVFFRNQPNDADETSDGEPQKKEQPSIAPVLHRPYFYISGICVFLVGFILQSATGIAKSHVLDVGISAEYVVTVFSIGSLLLAFAKMLNGFMFDRLGIRLTYTICCVCGIVALVMLAFMTSTSLGLAWGYSILHPFALPLETVMIPLLVTALFERKYYAKILGYYLALNTLGYACGIPFINIFYDAFGTYKGILIAYAVVLAIVWVVSMFSMKLAKKNRAVINN